MNRVIFGGRSRANSPGEHNRHNTPVTGHQSADNDNRDGVFYFFFSPPDFVFSSFYATRNPTYILTWGYFVPLYTHRGAGARGGAAVVSDTAFFNHPPTPVRFVIRRFSSAKIDCHSRFHSNIFLRQKHTRDVYESLIRFVSIEINFFQATFVYSHDIIVFVFLPVSVSIMIKYPNHVFPFPSNPSRFLTLYHTLSFFLIHSRSFGTIMPTTALIPLLGKSAGAISPFNGNNVKHLSAYIPLRRLLIC